ncbi:MAG: hypothetical protein HZA49_05315 [Planctomycetes bacterium]|nr:hypothetical protein [Planctomycetota bacterium]
MKTLLCVIAAIAFLALPVLAEDVKVTFDGSRLAAGYMDNGTLGNTTPGTFGAPDAKVKLNATFDADTSAVLRLNFDNGTANGADYAYVKLTNVIKKLAKSDTVNPDIYVGLIKVNFGEETWSNNPVENALVNNSIGGLAGEDLGVEFRQKALPIELPVTLGYSLSFLNGNGATDDTNTKAYVVKAMATMKSMPLYFSLSQYDSGRLAGGGNTIAMSSDLFDSFLATLAVPPGLPAGMYSKGYELNVRLDVLEGAQKFDPTKAPLASDAKAVLRLAYGAGAKGPMNLIEETTTMMLDALYNVDKQWFVAFRYSSVDDTVDTWTRMSIGGGHKLSDNSTLKLDYTTNTEPDTVTGGPEVDNNSVSLLMTVLW